MSNRHFPKIVGSDDWSWEGRWGRRGGFPMFGVFLIVFGLLLVGGEFFSWARVGTAAFFLAIGVVLIAVAVRDKSDLALFVGVFMAGLALSDFLSATNVVHGDGWGTLLVGIGWMLAALWRSSWGRRPGAAFVFGAILAVWGGFQVAQADLNFPADRLVGPVLIVLLGLWIVSRRARTSF